MGSGNDLLAISLQDIFCIDGRSCGLQWRHLRANDTVRATSLVTCEPLGDERRESNISFNVVI